MLWTTRLLILSMKILEIYSSIVRFDPPTVVTRVGTVGFLDAVALRLLLGRKLRGVLEVLAQVVVTDEAQGLEIVAHQIIDELGLELGLTVEVVAGDERAVLAGQRVHARHIRILRRPSRTLRFC